MLYWDSIPVYTVTLPTCAVERSTLYTMQTINILQALVYDVRNLLK